MDFRRIGVEVRHSVRKLFLWSRWEMMGTWTVVEIV